MMTRDESITLGNLLDEMIDFAALARSPQPKYRIAHCSSYNRASVSPDDPEGWFANGDNGEYIRKERNHGRDEFVIAEFIGPGCFVRLWTADRRIPPNVRMRGEETLIARVYLDGKNEPVLEGLFQDLFNGTGLFPTPFAHTSLSSAVCYFPIPFAESLKITLEGEPFYYNVTARIYEKGTKVESFTPVMIDSLSDKIREVGKRLLKPIAQPDNSAVSELRVEPGREDGIALPNGPGAITEVCLEVDATDPEALRGSVLRIAFDGEETVYCPVGEFFGCGPGLHPFSSLTREVDRDGCMRCRWVMPYQKHATVDLLNLDSRAHTYSIRIGTAPYTWDERSQYFHANWRYTYPLPTRPMSDWNYLTVEGGGRYVGDTLTVHNPVDIWWGEGDEKIWVDDDDFPSIFGTGTEDYYGYSWGGQNRAFYEHPMHAQVRVDEYDKLWTEPIPEVRVTRGVSTELRNLVLDSVIFESRLKYDMEIWHWEECEMAYAVACYWYGAAGVAGATTVDPDTIRRSMEDLRRFERQSHREG
jgi:hypothetical protein